MRLYSIHPKYLDRQGLLGLWREALLAQKVLQGKTNGYKHHPQLERFNNGHSLDYIGIYLTLILAEAQRRGYHFNAKLIKRKNGQVKKLTVTDGQLEYEFKHLQNKLAHRDRSQFKNNSDLVDYRRMDVEPHPLFEIVRGSIESWERIQ